MLLSNVPAGYVQGKDYVGIVTDDLFQMGKQAADALAAAMGKKGKVAWIFHDAQYYVTNQRDNAFKTTIEKDYPDIEIVAEPGHRRSGARRGDRQRAAHQEPRPRRHLRHLGRAGRRRPGGAARGRQHQDQDRRPSTFPSRSRSTWSRTATSPALIADKAYELGRTMATVGGLRPDRQGRRRAFVVAPAITVTKANVAEGWQHRSTATPPQSVLDAAK